MGKVLLNLDTLVVRPKISIDGRPFEILSPEELPVLTSHLLASKGARMEKLTMTAELGEDEEAELTSLVYEISDVIMGPVPADVRDKLSEAQRISVIEAFSTLLLKNKAGTAAALMASLLPTAAKPTGEKRRRGSSASTAGRRGGGSAKPRSHS